ncbi:Hypothetical protein CCH01_000120 [Clostridium chauvoei JF4335]|uniref:Uncharacterized protein n=1 Tax=Clostridium chauvoei JF4335 TaxID=1351755 RepID=S6F6T0_9CLOT|nr:Hypothetical protein CCH01_000120 [Clostridium chauvoei JF4335]SLK12348.1 Hypothetical protein CCH01_03130 [Clostridium chauvoei JF4335]
MMKGIINIKQEQEKSNLIKKLINKEKAVKKYNNNKEI